jgi:hypothetical protein
MAGGPARAAAVLVAALAAFGCGQGRARSAAEAEAAVLRRQIADLRGLLDASRRGALVSPDWLAVGVDEALLRELLQAGLPQERVVEGYRVRVETAGVRLRSALGLVTLAGRVSRADDPGTYADLDLQGSIHALAIDRRRGTLTGRVALDRFEVRRAAAAGAESGLVAAAVEALGLDVLSDLVPPLALPVHLDQDVPLPAFAEGPVSFAAGTLPVHLHVARVMPFEGRLWVLLEARVGSHREDPP